MNFIRLPNIDSISSLLAVVLLLFTGCEQRIPEAAPDSVERVSYLDRVIDGDTLQLASGDLVRLIGVDAPEKEGPYTRMEPGGKKAKAFVKRFLSDRDRLYLAFDHEKYDKHGRILAYVYREPDYRMLNQAIIQSGWARAYRRFRYRKKEEFIQVEQEAKKKQAGLWSDQ